MNTLEQLDKYIDLGWKVFPLKPNTKVPFTTNGFYDAERISSDKVTLEFWNEKTDNWGVNLGDSNLTVIDIDPRHGGKFTELEDSFLVESGDDAWKLPKTLLDQTGNNGYHLIYKGAYHLPTKLATGIDIKSIGGYAVLPPSIHPDTGNSYEWVNELDIVDLPEWIINLKRDEPKASSNEFKDETVTDTEIHAALAQLKRERADNYDDWKDVGMILHTLGDGYLPLWDTWSRQSNKYESGKCAEKWQTFRDDGGLTIKTLFFWAEEDSKGVYIRPASKEAKPSDYMNALHKMGYSFTMNKMNDRIYANGKMLSDGLESYMMTRLRESNYKNESIFKDAIVAEAFEQQFHPIEDYLNSFSWDGKDYIGELCSYFKDRDNIFPLLLRKWLIGAVAKILGSVKNEQNPMLVLDGKQGKGKSTFVWWLCSPLPEFYKASPINPEDKDHVIYSISYFVWEVEELGSTFRKADREALKAFLSRVWASVRPPYGKNEINKPVTCSYIGTLNDEGGFLTDPTGNRRFRVCTLESIDWNYTKLNVNNVWAQAVALFGQGETSNLSADENKIISEVNPKYEVEDTLTYHICDSFNIEPGNREIFTPTAEIMSLLKRNGIISSETDSQITKRIGAILTKLDLESGKKRIRAGENQYRGWFGISKKELTPALQRQFGG